MNKTPFEKIGDFLLGRGFYIVLFLCVATIGFSGFYLVNSLTPNSSDDTISPVAAAPEITIPDPVPTVTPAPVPAEKAKPSNKTPTPEMKPTVPTEEESSTSQNVSTQAPVKTVPAPAPAVYTWPVKGDILRPFSVETLSLDTTMGDWRTHSGVDIAAAMGTSVLSPSRGTVLSVYPDDMMGSTVVIQHSDGVISTLSNLASVPVVQEGDAVETGTVIGAVGDTAIAESGTPPHLHLEMTKDEEAINPLDLLP